MAMANAGWDVAALCPARHPLHKTRIVHQKHAYYSLAPLASFEDAISAAKPNLIIPCDDLATEHLHNLYHQQQLCGKGGALVCKLIERSLGAATDFSLMYSTNAFLELARQEGIRVPRTELIRTMEDLRRWITQMGLPTVLKANGTWGREGVRILETLEEAEGTFQRLQAPPDFARALSQALVSRDTRLIYASLARRRQVISGQQFLQGCDATNTVACWQGRVLAELHFQVLKSDPTTGSAAVLKLIENSEISTAVKRIVRRLNLSGLHGFDFLLETGTRNAYLIEKNPRATQVEHLTLGPGRDIPAALYAAVSGKTVQEAPKLTENDTIVLFPQEWINNPTSEFLRTGYHDVPLEEPELIRAFALKRWNRKASYSQQESIQARLEVRPPRPWKN